MLDGRRIAVVVPAHDETAHLAEVIATMPRFVDAIIVVDDASTDDTFAIAAGLAAASSGAETRRVIALRHAENRGVGAALVTGYLHAFSQGADVAAVMAGDGQMDPADLEAVLRPVLDGDADYVKGRRTQHPDAARMPRQRRWGSDAFGWATSWAAGVPRLFDAQCGYTAMHRRVAERIDLRALWPRYGYPNDLLGQIAAVGLSLREVEVRPVYRGEASGMRLRHALLIAALILRIRARRVARRRPASPAGGPVSPIA